ncbi:xanthine dehydrogenase family protein molybdopterin-binding subunit [Lysobacter hankyongensis]|uniref:Xanthine dehydrogenase family protein molybdopterin-binding subunit n=1 Tax=Lysobacter hankyongensis TaxID=1176535 RepID=A0ABP9B2N4_9GAMM
MFNGRKLSALATAAATPTLSRRQFVLGASLLGSALLVGCRMQADDSDAPAPSGAIKPSAGSPFEAYIAIAADGIVTVYSSQFDMGQNSYHGLATLVAEELDVALDKVRVEGRAGNPKWYGNLAMGGAFQLTGGSSSMPSSWERYRKAGAAARELLKQAAAKQWQVAIGELSTANGEVVHAGSDRRAPYGSLIAAAAPLPVPGEVALKDAKAWTLIGKDATTRIDARAKSDGTQAYTIDIRLPGMLVATVAHSPRFGGKVASFDATAAKAVPGVVDVVQISRGVAVVANNTWAAIKGREALQVTWDDSGAETRSSDAMFTEYEALSKQDGKVALQRGDAAGKLAKAAKTLEATYRFPYLAHAALEPLNAVIHKDGDRLHIHGGLQMPDAVQAACAQIAGVKPEQVDLHVMKTGGGFGRRAVADCDVFVEATEIAKALDFRAPIKLQWTREADMGGGRYRPLHLHRVRVGLGADGSISGWQHHIVGQSIMAGTPFEAMMMKDGIDPTSTEGVADTPYALPDIDVRMTHPASPVPVLWWRSVGHTHTAYVMQTMLDEIATATGQDPVALRLALLPADARERAVLSLVAEKAGWSQPVAAGRFRGVAVHQSFGSYVATVAEISKTADGGIRVERCVVASDCGTVINPDVVRAQIEGGTGFGLSAMLGEAIALENGAPTARNYDAYRVLRIDAMPTVEVHMLPSTASPTGIGECAVPPIGPAVANAIFQATGKRVRDLPLLKA